MAHHFHNDLVPFPTPWGNTTVYHSPFYLGGGHHRSRFRRPDKNKDLTDFTNLYDKNLADHSGDLGWSLDYATAWLYRHLCSNRPGIADCIDAVRELGDDGVEPDTPYLIFNYLDAAVFAGKLRNMVYLRWKIMPGNGVGRTSAPGLFGPRICIDLNRVPFMDDNDEGDEGGIDDLLEALIHQMIHAFFLVCCGAQKKGEKADGRLEDGLHFGVILRTIADITEYCEEESLILVFHAHKRRQTDGSSSLLREISRPQRFIALDPLGNATIESLADGQSHCMHDNRRITKASIRNWQVESYSKYLELDTESKGPTVFDFSAADGKLKEFERLEAPPSLSYCELVWEEAGTKKHVMVNREKALRFESIEWPLKKHGRYELEIPKGTDKGTFACLYDFLLKSAYVGNEPVALATDGFNLEQFILQNPLLGLGDQRRTPVLRKKKADWRPAAGILEEIEPAADILKHIRVFKCAEKLKFEELLSYALSKLWATGAPGTEMADHPMSCLEELYESKKTTTAGPIHPELHKWSRNFLLQRDDGLGLDLRHARRQLDAHTLAMAAGFPWPDPLFGGGAGRSSKSNWSKLWQWHPERFLALWNKSGSFRDDLEIVLGQRRRRLPGLAPAAGLPMPAGVQERVEEHVVDDVPVGGALLGNLLLGGAGGLGGIGGLGIGGLGAAQFLNAHL